MHQDQNEVIKQLSDKSEETAKKIFVRLGFECDRVDRNGPDYHVYRLENAYRFLCEVKCILSGGWSKKRREHYSVVLEPSAIKRLDFNSVDPRPALTVIPQKDQFQKLEEALGKARRQRNSLITANASYAEYAELPFVVALYLYPGADLWPDELQLVMREYPEISAIVKEFTNCQRDANMWELSEDELIDKLEVEASTGEAQFERGFWDESHWHYVLNDSAVNPFVPQQLGVCPYDEFVKR
jgi:hypothetical protein